MKYRPEIDGLRALAVLPVLFYHAGFAGFSGGFIGVDVFFVISGYLISTLILNDLAAGRFSLARFYERRARRILPALFLVMLTSMPVAWLWLMPSGLNEFLNSLLATLVFASNIFFWDQTGYFDTAAELKPMLHTWSLAVEEQFYIVFPLLLMAFWRLGVRGLTWLMGGLFVLSLVYAQWSVQGDPASAFFLPMSRVWELLAGTLAAFHLRTRPRNAPLPVGNLLTWLGFALILGPVVAYDSQMQFPGVTAVAPVLGATLIILFATRDTMIGKLLSARFLVTVGLMSYSLYLWHYPIFALFRNRFGRQAFEDHVYLLLALSFLLAWLSLWLVERPFRFRASLRQFSVATGVSVAGLVTAGLWIDGAIETDPSEIPSYARALRSAPPEIIAYSEGQDAFMPCSGEAGGYGFRTCSFGARQADQSIAIWGDSLAQAALFGFDQVTGEQGLGGVMIAADGCPPVMGLTNIRVPECTDQTHEEILRRIAQLPDLQSILLIGNFNGAMEAANIRINGGATSFDRVKQQMERTVSRIRATTGARVYLVEQGPVFPEPVAKYYIENVENLETPTQTLTRKGHLEANRQQRHLAAVMDGYVPTVDLFCDPDACPSITPDGRMIIYDRSHMTKEFSVDFARYVLRRLGSAGSSGGSTEP